MLEGLKGLFPDATVKEDEFELYKRARGLYIEDPWERVKSIFSRDPFNNLHPELQYSVNVAQIGFFFGAFIGGFKESVRQTKEFVRTNDTNVYLNRRELYRVMSHKSILAMGKGGLKWGPKIGLFSGGFSLVTSCCEAYRNKPGIIEYVVGGYVVGGISRSAFGIKGFIAGGIVGATLGLIYGTLYLGIQKLIKKDALVIKYSQFAYSKYREELFHKSKSSKKDAADILASTMHGEHAKDPLNTLDSKNENPESKKEK